MLGYRRRLLRLVDPVQEGQHNYTAALSHLQSIASEIERPIDASNNTISELFPSSSSLISYDTEAARVFLFDTNR